MGEYVTVNMADYKLAKGRQQLITRDLGSCVGIAIWDSEKGIGGLLHIMLPSCPPGTEVERYPKYADKGIELMVSKLVLAGARRERMTAKLAGAAHIVKTQEVPESEDISSRNLAAVRSKLKELNIPVLAMEVGDYFPRTMIFEPGSGILQIKTFGKPDRIL